jgi:hypothetical protein
VFKNLSLVVWGENLPHTVGVRFTLAQSRMVRLASYPYDVIIGVLLSDGGITFSSKKSKNARLCLKQSVDRSNYVWFVFFILSHYCSNYPELSSNPRYGKSYPASYFFTRAMPCITELHSLFYSKTQSGFVKIVPVNIYELLTPVALAHLIMGDGTFKNKGISICTDSYTIQDTVRLMNVLIIRYELKCTLHKASNGLGYRIYISRHSVGKVVELVKPYFIPSMYYKLGI